MTLRTGRILGITGQPSAKTDFFLSLFFPFQSREGRYILFEVHLSTLTG